MKRREILKSFAVLPFAGVTGDPIPEYMGRDGLLLQIDCIAYID